MVKTTIELDEELWKKFSIKVIQKYGGRKKTDIFEALAEAFVNTPEKMVQEAVEDWIRQRKDKKKRSH
jgi:predicted CopG family antitoxin